MERVPVSSSNIAAVGYDPETETLEVEFKNGGVYQYENVPSAVHYSLVMAPSVGGYFHSQIKDVYPTIKVL